MAAKRTQAPGTTPATATTRTGGSTTWQRHISAELGRLSAEMGAGFDAATTRMDALAAEISAERDVRQARERAEVEKRAARRATDPVIEQIYAQQQAEAAEREAAEKRTAEREAERDARAHERARKIIAVLIWLGGEVFTLIGQKLAPASDMHAVTIAGSLISVLPALGVYLKRRQ